MSFDQPRLVVGRQPSLECVAQLLDRAERSHPQELFLERANESLRDAVAFRCPHESRTGDHPQKPEFGLEVGAHILIAMIMADLQTRRDRRGEGPELLADALQSAVIDGHEDSHGAVHQRDGAGGIGAPHLMRLVSEDRAVVGVRSQNPSGSARGQVVGLPH